MTDIAPVRFGVLGAASIARLFTRGVAGSAVATVAAVASRGADKANAFAAELGIPRAYGSYEALLAAPDIDALYIPLPNDMHAAWAIRAVEAGKHVLCEKPLAMTGQEARAMFAAARKAGVHLVEAYPYMSQPQTLRLRELLAGGTLGRVRSVAAGFSYNICTPEGAPRIEPTNVRLVVERGGGALRDAGTYAMSMLRLAVGERPKRVMAWAQYAETGVDHITAATVLFPGGAVGQLFTSISSASQRYAVIVGETGVVETDFGNHWPSQGSLSLRVKLGMRGESTLRIEETPGGDGFRAEADSFARMVRLGAGEWNGASEAESIDTVLALEAIAASARSGAWVEVG